MAKNPLRIAMLISGGGTTARAIMRACVDGELEGMARPVLLISSSADASGIQRAMDAGMHKGDVVVIRRRDFSDSVKFGEANQQPCGKPQGMA